MKKLQIIQNNAVRWICNDRWPVQKPLRIRHQELKLEYIEERLRRMAMSIWDKIEEENNTFFQETIQIQMVLSHNSYPSSYNKTYEKGKRGEKCSLT